MVAGHSDPGKSVFGTSALNESAAEASPGSPSLGAHGGDGMCRSKQITLASNIHVLVNF
jgi:hypothetical protein